MREIFRIFKREKPAPSFEDNWKQEQFEKNIKRGVESLRQGKEIHILDDGRGYELAIEIKKGYLLELQKQLSERIKIENKGKIIVKIEP